MTNMLLILLSPDAYLWLLALALTALTLALWLCRRRLRRGWLRWGLAALLSVFWCVFIYGSSGRRQHQRPARRPDSIHRRPAEQGANRD